jgi:magnesium and cobalt transporter
VKPKYWRNSDITTLMPEEHSHTSSWLRRITGSLSGEPRDLEDLNDVLGQAHERGIIDADAHQMLEGVLRVVELQVRDIMVPRSQMVIVNRDDPPEEILPMVVDSGHSRYPVIGDDRDQIVGILLAKDLLRYFAEGGRANFDIKECLRPAVFIPESKRLNVLLKEFRVSHHHMAIVVDEYGGVSGLVTIEDVLEQIVGDIGDEYDTDDDLDIRKEGERQFTVKAQTRIDEFNSYFGCDFSDEEFDTIGGLAINSLGRLPRRGESFALGGLEFKVLRADRRRLDLLRVITPRDIEPRDEE